MKKKRAVFCVGSIVLLMRLVPGTHAAQVDPPPKTDVVTRLIQDVPDDFPRFSFAGHAEQARLLTHFLWYHFHHRLGNSKVLFNKEYLLTADVWLGNARPRGSSETIQQVHRRTLLELYMDPEGYVSSHQHFSHAHDLGWPFPYWAQAHKELPRVKGLAAGWHFQPLEKVRGWIGGHLRASKGGEYVGEAAVSRWERYHLDSLGIKNDRWHLVATGPSPALISPSGYEISAFDAPYLQLRWKRSGTARVQTPPYVEWLGENDAHYDAQRRVYFFPERTPLSKEFFHSIIPMYRHPGWHGRIKRLRLVLAPGESDVRFEIDSFFTVYDTRHTINNPIFILASDRYFRWTGDLDFLRRQINRMRLALRYQQTEMGGLEFNHIRNTWPGHDGLPSWHKDPDGTLTFHSGHGIGSNYWDILPFGWDDMYATNQYYAATCTMAALEEAIRRNPQWNVPCGTVALDPAALRRHARQIKETANRLFWNEKKGRFVACIDRNGQAHDYGYTFLNLDAIWYDLATVPHARLIMDWLDGRRIVPGDTSTGADIYRWRFGPRSSTRRNIEWYGQGWWAPESLPWGYQVQDGGAVLGFTFYDLWARLHLQGPDDAWRRLKEILAWEKEVHAAGGYRAYYRDEKRGTTLQGGGTCGGLGIDYEFFESSLVPAIVPYGFLGLQARADGALAVRPCLPSACPEMGIQNILYHGCRLDLRVTNRTIEVTLTDPPVEAIRLVFEGTWRQAGMEQRGSTAVLDRVGRYTFVRCP